MRFSFGKHKGMEVSWVFAHDREYCEWFLENIRRCEDIKSELKAMFENESLPDKEKEYTKLTAEILLGLEKNGRSKHEAETILSKFIKHIRV
jgi:hypothetical protein